MRAELTAIVMALAWIEQYRGMSVIFLIDSLSALQALESSQIKNNLVVDILYKLRILKTLDIDVYFEWIPSHCGVQGNEIADKLAKKGSSKEIIELEIPYICI